MKIIYVITDTVESAFDRITSPSHAFYDAGVIIGRIILFIIGYKLMAPVAYWGTMFFLKLFH